MLSRSVEAASSKVAKSMQGALFGYRDKFSVIFLGCKEHVWCIVSQGHDTLPSVTKSFSQIYSP